jgi:hypothetical protein
MRNGALPLYPSNKTSKLLFFKGILTQSYS